jgi:hypothetical protein
MECSVLNGSEHTDGCFTAVFFQTQHASISVQCSGCTVVGSGNGTWKNIPACVHERQNNCTATSHILLFQTSAHIMDLDFEIFDSERLITEVEKRAALYNWLIDYRLGSSPNGPDAPRPLNGPFVAHNLISAQWSPVPCWSSRWPPDLTFMSSGSKKRNPDILFSQKSQ